jgi:hypothetical protein
MIGCVLATVGVIGLLKMAHRRHHGYGYGGYGCGGGGRWRRHGFFPHHHHHMRHGGQYDGDADAGGFGQHEFGDHGPEDGGGFGAAFGGGGLGRGFGRRFIIQRVLDSLETSPAQEKVIFSAAEEFRDEAKKFRGELRKSRGDVAGAFRKASFDEVMLGELYARHDTAIEGLRKAFVGLGAKVHDALDEKQRARLADIIESGPRGFAGRLFRSRFARGGFDRHGWDW